MPVPPASSPADSPPASSPASSSPASASSPPASASPPAASGSDLSSLTLRPIGVVRSPFRDKVSAPRQPAAARDVTATIHLFPRPGMEHAVEDLDGCTHLWIVFWFHEAHDFRPKVLPPRSPDKRRGVLATRSPHRPNPIGLSVVRLDRVDGLTLHIRDVDMLDGTPVLDVKPYVSYCDSVPDARVAWLQPLVADAGVSGGDGAGEGASENGPPRGVAQAPARAAQLAADPEPGFVVSFEPAAAHVLAFLLATFNIDLASQITAVLSLGPQPHPYRRIRKIEGGFQLAVKDWRARFVAGGRHIRVTAIETGYRPSQLAMVDGARDVDGERAKSAPVDDVVLAPHRAVWERFGQGR